MPLMTRVKSPSVKIVIGSVSKRRMGFNMALAIPKITPTTTAVINDSTWTPGNTYEEMITAAALVNRLINNFIG